MSREGNFKFVLRTSPSGQLAIWGLPGNFDFSLSPSRELVWNWIEERRLLRYEYPEWDSGSRDFFFRLRKDILHWYEDPWVFLSTDENFRDREFNGQRVFVIPEASAPKEIRFVQKMEGLAAPDSVWPKSPTLAREKLLLHVCCGPDAAGVVAQLKEDFDLECFWYDPNIQPREEHDKRLEAFRQVMGHFKIPHSEGPYEVEVFNERIRGLEWTPEQGAKCSQCYDLRLEKSAQVARDRGFPSYATTLAISPHKVQQKLMNFGQLHYRKYGVRYFHRPFLKKDGFNDSVDFTREHHIYRQDYCGCFYSLHEGGQEARETARRLGYWPAEKSNATLPVSGHRG